MYICYVFKTSGSSSFEDLSQTKLVKFDMLKNTLLRLKWLRG